METPQSPERTTHVIVEAVADCPFSIADEYTAEYLRAAEERGPEATIHVPWYLPLPIFRRRVFLSFGIHSDVTELGRAHDEIRVRWESGAALLPDFRGTIRFRIDEHRTRITIDGSYTPPLGIAGRAMDAVAGRWIARASMQDLADRIARNLTARQHAWRAEHAGRIAETVTS